MYTVRRRRISALEAEAEAEASPAGRHLAPHRVVFCGSALPASRVQSLVQAMTGEVEVCSVSPSTWKGVLRNVPLGEGVDASDDAAYPAELAASQEVVIVARASQARACGPVLVLVNLKYRGNVGTIVRAAVQANCFKAIYFVGLGNNSSSSNSNNSNNNNNNNEHNNTENKQAGVKATAAEHYHWEKNKNKGVKDVDISYYSLHNAPLIDKRRFETVHDFLDFAEKTTPAQPMIGIDGGTTFFGAPLSLYSKEAAAMLNGGSDFYLAMGAEDNGLPDAFLTRCSSLISIPCLSASINVSCAFSMVLAVMQLTSAVKKEGREIVAVRGEQRTSIVLSGGGSSGGGNHRVGEGSGSAAAAAAATAAAAAAVVVLGFYFSKKRR
jgi:tRNA G18 (ribose-2'-O)-methylase SpoU